MVFSVVCSISRFVVGIVYNGSNVLLVQFCSCFIRLTK